MEPSYNNIAELFNDIKKLTAQQFLEHLNQLWPGVNTIEDLVADLSCSEDVYTPEDIERVGQLAKEIFVEIPEIPPSNDDYSELYYLEPYQVFIKRTADYYSYSGFENFSDFKIVQKINKMITVYE